MVGRSKKSNDGGVVVDHATKVNQALAQLHKKIHTSHTKKLKVDDSLRTAESAYEKHSGVDKKLSAAQKMKLKTVYGTALQDCQQEADALRKCLADIAHIRKLRHEKRFLSRKTSGCSAQQQQSTNSISAGAFTPSGATKPQPAMRRGALMVLLQQSANTLPLFVGKLNEVPPHLCGAIGEESGHICQPGDAVAALVKGEEEEENWILAEVISNTCGVGNKYEVEDVDEEQKLRYTLPKRKVIPLPQWRANPDTDGDALFPQDAVVLALYPQTTCFYKGVVEQVPVSPTDDYLVAFEDSSYPSNYSPPLPVPQRYVVAYRDVKK